VPNYFEKDQSGSSKRRITYRRIPVYDSATSDLLSHADSIVGFIASGMRHGSVLVHCKEGVSRSTTCVILFLMR
jgi:protein-tyrosine phosphatase